MTMPAPYVFEAPAIRPEWIDYNGHLNVAYYLLMFDQAVDQAMTALGLSHARIQETGQSLFAMEAHLTWRQELRLGDEAVIEWQLLDHDAKKLHYIMTMRHKGQGFVAALCEQLALHVNLSSRKSAPFAADILSRIDECARAHAALPRPDAVGARIAIRRPSAPNVG